MVMEFLADSQNYFREDRLHAGGQIGVMLRQLRFRLAGRTTEQPVKPSVSQPRTVAQREIVGIEVKTAVRLDVDEMLFDRIGVDGLAIGRKSHQFVFAVV